MALRAVHRPYTTITPHPRGHSHTKPHTPNPDHHTTKLINPRERVRGEGRSLPGALPSRGLVYASLDVQRPRGKVSCGAGLRKRPVNGFLEQV